jgi:hypothetical protein
MRELVENEKALRQLPLNSSSLFPYLYDFTLNTFIYYFPDTKNAGHYTTNSRYFSNLTTGMAFTM